MSEEPIMRTMLFDFYGDLLTDKQREYYDLHYNEDLSLYEIAEHSGVSRQAVWDIIRRAETIMLETERKTGFVAKAVRRRELVRRTLDELGELEGLTGGRANELVRRIKTQLEQLEE